MKKNLENRYMTKCMEIQFFWRKNSSISIIVQVFVYVAPQVFIFSKGIYVKLSTWYLLCVVRNLPHLSPHVKPTPPPFFSQLLSPAYLLFTIFLPY